MHIEIDFTATDPPEGDVRSSDAPEAERFAGWLALVSTIERLLGTRSGGQAPPKERRQG